MNQNEKGMTFVWSVLVFGPTAPFYIYVTADTAEEARQVAQRQYPVNVISEWIERDLEMESDSRELVENCLLEASYDAMVQVAKRRNGRI